MRFTWKELQRGVVFDAFLLPVRVVEVELAEAVFPHVEEASDRQVAVRKRLHF